MCGRYAIAPESPEAWVSVAEALGAELLQALLALQARHNIAPTMPVPIILRSALGRVQLLEARWGFVPRWWKEAEPPRFNTANVRSEEAASKATWRDAWRLTRCLIPASHWYEWQQTEVGKQPHALSAADGKAYMLAGLYSVWTPPTGEPVHTCAILTRAASESAATVHDRMPVILHPDGWLPWLDPRQRDPQMVAALLADHAVLEVRSWRVSTRVNTPRNDDAALLAPL